MVRLRKMPFGSTGSQSGGGGVLSGIAFAATLCLLAVSTSAHAQSGAQQDSIGEDAIDAVTQPLSDLNLRSREIPLILTMAEEQPYDMTDMETCSALRTEVARLEDVLGPDADEPREGVGLINRGLRTGGDMLGDFIPFRGLVRRVSGARAEEKRWESAVYAGVARRSFLKGYMAGQRCETAEEESVRSARDLLGLPDNGDDNNGDDEGTGAN